MRTFLLAGSLMIAAPLPAQEHTAHGHGSVSETAPVDHCAMGHLPAEQCPPSEKAVDEHAGHGSLDEPSGAGEHSQHRGMDHSQHHASGQDHPPPTDRSQMDHAQQGQMDHSGHAMPDNKTAPDAAPESATPARAFEGPRHAADAIWGEDAMAPSRAQLARENGAMKTGMLMIERLEARIPADGGETGYVWDGQGWYGGDINRLVLKTEGEGEFGGDLEDAEIQALYSRAIGPFFDLQAGLRLDAEPEARTHAVIGVQGLAPYMFHVDGALFLSDRGDLTARLEAEYDQKIKQALILQPRIEVEASAQDVPEREVGAGLTKIEPGLRLRYEIEREFAPYVGFEYEAKLGRTADLARAEGEDPDGFKFLLGLRAWF